MAKVYKTADMVHVASPIIFLKDNKLYADYACTTELSDREIAIMYLNNAKVITTWTDDPPYFDCGTASIEYMFDGADMVTFVGCSAAGTYTRLWSVAVTPLGILAEQGGLE